MKANLVKNIFAILMIATFALAACNPLAPSPVEKFAAAGYDKILLFKQYYADTVPLESKYSAAFQEWWAFKDNGLAQLKDMKFLSDNCYANVYKILDDTTIGMYDKGQTADGIGNGALDKTKLVSALVTNNLYPANADKCSAMLESTLQEVVKIRQGGFEKQMAFIETRRTLVNQYKGTVDHAVLTSLLQQYGAEFIRYMNGQLTTHGIAPFPSDFIGFPTLALEVYTTSADWCDYYSDANFKPSKGFSKEMYGAEWIGPTNGGQCHLTRQAAFEFTSRSFLSKATQNSLNCGDAGPSLSESTDEKCKTVPNNPNSTIPTATPAKK